MLAHVVANQPAQLFWFLNENYSTMSTSGVRSLRTNNQRTNNVHEVVTPSANVSQIAYLGGGKVRWVYVEHGTVPTCVRLTTLSAACEDVGLVTQWKCRINC